MGWRRVRPDVTGSRTRHRRENVCNRVRVARGRSLDGMSIAADFTAPVGWAKAKPLAFVLLIVIALGLGIRFRAKLTGLPVIGRAFQLLGGSN